MSPQVGLAVLFLIVSDFSDGAFPGNFPLFFADGKYGCFHRFWLDVSYLIWPDRTSRTSESRLPHVLFEIGPISSQTCETSDLEQNDLYQEGKNTSIVCKSDFYGAKRLRD